MPTAYWYADSQTIFKLNIVTDFSDFIFGITDMLSRLFYCQFSRYFFKVRQADIIPIYPSCQHCLEPFTIEPINGIVRSGYDRTRCGER